MAHGGKRPGSGRKKGVPNKVTTAVKEMVLGAAEDLGGRERLVAWAKEDPVNERIFWGNIAMKAMPLEVTGPDGGPHTIHITREVIGGKA